MSAREHQDVFAGTAIRAYRLAGRVGPPDRRGVD
jgi:hypothetical protein